MKVKTADLIGPALDWAVAKCEGPNSVAACYLSDEDQLLYLDEAFWPTWEPSLNWSQGGPLIQRECLDVRVFAEHGAPDGGPYWISERHPAVGHGPHPTHRSHALLRSLPPRRRGRRSRRTCLTRSTHNHEGEAP